MLSTKHKISIAKILYRITALVFGKKPRIIVRNGIMYEVHPSEGIDLSLFLFGNFQAHVTDTAFYSISDDGVVIDVGANFGIMSLQFAKKWKHAVVYAFEPTSYAREKFNRNMALNPELAKRIHLIPSFVGSKTSASTSQKAFSSWKVDGTAEDAGEDRHPVHFGSAKATDGAGVVRLDDFAAQNNFTRVDFIKIDTDGYEYDVFAGAKEMIQKFKPAVIFEVGLYVMEDHKIGFEFYQNYFDSLKYKMINSADGKPVTLDNYKKVIPERSTIDILAMPQ